MMKYLIFLKINSYYLLLDDDLAMARSLKEEVNKAKFFHEEAFECLENGKLIKWEILKNIFGDRLKLDKNRYLVCECRDYYVFKPLRKKLLLGWSLLTKRKKATMLKRLGNYGKARITSFELKRQNALSQRLMGKEKVLEDCLKAFSDFVFCERYSLWVYNKHTDVFSCMAASNPYKKNYIEKKDGTKFYEFMDGGLEHESRAPGVNLAITKGMEALNRLRLDFGGDDTIGIVSFYSKHSDFELWPKVRSHIKEFIELKYIERREKSKLALRNVVAYMAHYEVGKIDGFLNKLVCKICGELCFEACSIFLKDRQEDRLILRATCDKDHKGPPTERATYDLNKDSFTVSVFKTKKMLFSYDLPNDYRNTHGYDEETDQKPQNWIVMPLFSDSKKWGVLRVKNKYREQDKREIKNFRPIDFESLYAVCTHLCNILQIEEVHRNYVAKNENLLLKGNDLQKRFDDLGNFYQVFMHEIRTPISTFSTSTMVIKRLLGSGDITGEKRASIKNKLDDIKVMGGRLAFIANTYQFRELIKMRKTMMLSVMRHIVLPVMNITQDYIRKQFDVAIYLISPTLEDQYLYGDQRLLTMVFNALVSNAGKYSTRSKEPISVYGERDKSGGHFYIVVENYGFKIHEDEKEKVFENRYQGRQVRGQKLGGTGIGLYLAREIMRKHNGDVLLSSLNNPVTFKIKLPVIDMGRRE